MLHVEHLHQWLCHGLIQTESLCQSSKGNQYNRLKITKASVGTWYGSSYSRKQEMKNKSLGEVSFHLKTSKSREMTDLQLSHVASAW